MFVNHDEAKAYRFFFSPGAVRIFGATLALWSAIEATQPAANAVTILIGREEAAEELLDRRRS
jgi:hypothetical protein